jgi:hypothetical protein
LAHPSAQGGRKSGEFLGMMRQQLTRSGLRRVARQAPPRLRALDRRKALAHLHLAHAGVPPCEEEQALRLFVADELIEAGVAPRTLMKVQGFDPAPLALLKANFNPAQPRWLAGRRDKKMWSSLNRNCRAGSLHRQAHCLI